MRGIVRVNKRLEVGRLRLEVKETRGGRDLRDLMYDSGKVLRWEGGKVGGPRA